MPNTKKTIVLDDRNNIRDEATGSGTIYPGYLLEKTSAGKYKAHATVSGSWGGAVALEDALQGNGVDDAYSNGDKIIVGVFHRGAVVNLVLQDGESVAIGDQLDSNGDGTIRKVTGASSIADLEESQSIVGEALEALDLSGSSGAESSALQGDRRLAVRLW